MGIAGTAHDRRDGEDTGRYLDRSLDPNGVQMDLLTEIPDHFIGESADPDGVTVDTDGLDHVENRIERGQIIVRTRAHHGPVVADDHLRGALRGEHGPATRIAPVYHTEPG